MLNSPITTTYTQTLTQAGLSAEQAQIYEVLLKQGPSSARKVAQNTPLKRSLVYKILDDLIKLGLVEKADAIGKISIFTPAHPLKLKEFVERQEQKAKTAQVALDGLMGSLTSDFNLASGKPGIQFYEGLTGLEKIYNDILSNNQDFYLIRSAYEPNYENKVVPILNKFIEKRIKKGLKVTALTPSGKSQKKYSEEEDKKNLYLRTWIPNDFYNSPVEIDIYGDKIAMLSFGKELIGVTIESPQISRAIKQIFLLSEIGAGKIPAKPASDKTAPPPAPSQMA